MTRRDAQDHRPPVEPSDEAIWRQCREMDAVEDEAARFLDLAGFADGRLDDDDTARIAAMLSADPAAAADVAAARALTADADQIPPAKEPIVARAVALVAAPTLETAQVIPLATVRARRFSLPGLAGWGSLAAAVIVASWLGFAMGSDTSRAFVQLNQPRDDAGVQDILQPSSGLLQDLTGGAQT